MSQSSKKFEAPPALFNPTTVSLKQPTYEALAAKIYQLAGLHLPYNDKNLALMCNRLSRLLRDNKLTTYEQLNEKLKFPDEKLKVDFRIDLATGLLRHPVLFYVNVALQLPLPWQRVARDI